MSWNARSILDVEGHTELARQGREVNRTLIRMFQESSVDTVVLFSGPISHTYLQCVQEMALSLASQHLLSMLLLLCNHDCTIAVTWRVEAGSRD